MLQKAEDMKKAIEEKKRRLKIAKEMAAEVEHLRGRRGRRGCVTRSVAEAIVIASATVLGAEGSQIKYVEGLGDGKHVPSYLRTDKTIKIREIAVGSEADEGSVG